MTDTFDPPSLPGNPTTSEYLVDDPLTPDQELILNEAWAKFDDLYDSIDGGPHLKEVSKTSFTAAKSSLLMSYAVARINYHYNPVTEYDLNNFPYSTDHTVLAQGLVVELIMHLIRSYTEQPDTNQGESYSRLSRRDYIDRWRSVLDQEKELLDLLVAGFKRKAVGEGMAGLVSLPKGFGLAGLRGRLRARGYRYGGW